MALQKVSQGLIDNITKKFESLHDGDLTIIGLQPKLDPVGIWTEGWGSAIVDPKTHTFVKGLANKARAYELHTINNEADANVALLKKYGEISANVNGYKLSLTQNQFDALCDFAYNCGTGALSSSSVLKCARGLMDSSLVVKTMEVQTDDIRNYLIKKKIDTLSALRLSFLKWCKGTNPKNGKLEILEGLWRRRDAEYCLYVTPPQPPAIVPVSTPVA